MLWICSKRSGTKVQLKSRGGVQIEQITSIVSFHNLVNLIVTLPSQYDTLTSVPSASFDPNEP
ncbi:hypothetical protein K443DRAFT_332169 [Laccaria amethystina LaAM-08-1]|uniref:Unplaced genomic scaffold K443scaffold_228, whole genome shotgun sequence n=1 Tax=Laccaria amethystina LaAM-08-1 TaxID=1095629 RepID=A0A0C9XGF6_9AGAR|nr:hypothetical protein K443DRAFT_332169 [Laccaria amethystina LaAM-08-1]